MFFNEKIFLKVLFLYALSISGLLNSAYAQTGQVRANTGETLNVQPNIATLQANTDGYGLYATGGGIIYSDVGIVVTNGANAAGLFAAETGSVIHWAGTTITTNGLRGRGIDTVRGAQVTGYGTIITNGEKAHAIQAGDSNLTSGPATVTLLSGTTVHTVGNGSYGLHAYGSGILSGTVNVITEGISSFGAHAEKNSSITLGDSTIETHGLNAIGLLANTDGITAGVSYIPGQLNAKNTTVRTKNTNAFGVLADVQASIHLTNVTVETLGENAIGLFANRGGTIISQGGVTTSGGGAHGVAAGMTLGLDMIDRVEHEGSIVTKGAAANGVIAQNQAQLKIAGSILTKGELSHGVMLDTAHISLTSLAVNTEGDHAIGLYATNGATLNGQANITTLGTSAYGILLEAGSTAILESSTIQTHNPFADGAVVNNSTLSLKNSHLLSKGHGISITDSSVVTLMGTSIGSKLSAIDATFSQDAQQIALNIGGNAQIHSETGNFLTVNRGTAEGKTGQLVVNIQDSAVVSGNIFDTESKTTGFTDVSLGANAEWSGQAKGVRHFNALSSNSRVSFAKGSELLGDVQSENSTFDFHPDGISIGGSVFLTNNSHAAGGSQSAPITVAGNTIIDATSTQHGQWTIAGDLENNGFIAPGNSIGTITVGGNYMTSDTSVYQVEINGSGESDLIQVAGTAFLAGKVSVVTSGNASGFLVNQRYTILSAKGGLNGTTYTGGLSWNNAPSYLYVTPQLIYDTQNVYLVMARNNLPVVTLEQTPNEQGVGGVIGEAIDNGAPYSPLINAFLLHTDARAVRAALSLLSGSFQSTLPGILIEDSRFLRDAANDRLRQITKLTGGDATSVAVGNTDDKSGVTLWGQGFGSWGRWNATSQSSRLERSVGGLFIGADTAVNNWQLGTLAGYSHASVDAENQFSSASTDNYHLGLYAGRQWGSLALRAGLAHSWHIIETSRSVVFSKFSDHLNADYRASTTQVFGELGYGITKGAYQFEPFANLSYVHINRKSFTENGGEAALFVGSQIMDTTFTTLGLRAETLFDIGSISAKARGTLGWKHAFGDTDTVSSRAFSFGNVFDVSGMSVVKDVAVVEAGLDFALTRNATIGLSYSGQFASKARDQSFKATLAVKF